MAELVDMNVWIIADTARAAQAAGHKAVQALKENKILGSYTVEPTPPGLRLSLTSAQDYALTFNALRAAFCDQARYVVTEMGPPQQTIRGTLGRGLSITLKPHTPA